MLSPSARALSSAPLLSLLAISRGLELSFERGSYVVTEAADPCASHGFALLSDLEAFLLWLPLSSASLPSL